MKEIELTQGKVAIVDDDDYEYLRQFNWHYDRYAVRQQYLGVINGKRCFKTIYMHTLINKPPKGIITDHINGDKLDNRRENLRACTYSQNNLNRLKLPLNKTGFRGVVIRKEYFNGKVTEYIRAQIKLNNKNKFLGHFPTLEDAARAYNKAALEYQGEFAQLNEVA